MQTAHEVILDYMILSENRGRVGYPMLHTALKHSWYNLFIKTKESVVRKWYPIKNSKCNWPDTAERILGIYNVDSCGDLVAIYEDVMINILPKPALKCGCSSCSGCMCGEVHDTVIQTDVVIDGVTRQNKEVTRISNGNIIKEYHTWAAVYSGNSVSVGAKEVVTQETKCSLELSTCGCISNTEDNAKKILGCGCAIDSCAPAIRKEYKALDSEFGYYKNDEINKVIHFFDRKGGKSNLTQMIIVFQSNGRDMLVPEYCSMALMALLNYVKMMFSPSYDRSTKDEAKRMATVQKKEMLRFLNPIPFEHFVQLGENRVKLPYYAKPHSDFVQPQICNSSIPINPTQNITNISYVTGIGGNNWLKAVVDEGNISGTAYITIDTLGNVGDRIEISYIDSLAGLIFLGSYTSVITDTTIHILAANIALAMAQNSFGYTFTVVNNIITVKAPVALGSRVNGSSLIVSITEQGVFDDAFDDTFW